MNKKDLHDFQDVAENSSGYCRGWISNTSVFKERGAEVFYVELVSNISAKQTAEMIKEYFDL